MTGDRLLDPGGPAVTPAESTARRAEHRAAQVSMFDVELVPDRHCPSCARVVLVEGTCDTCRRAGRHAEILSVLC